MPSIQCDNGKWKWGENGSCIYDSKKESDNANSDYRAISDIDFTPTQGMIDEAKKGKGDVIVTGKHYLRYQILF